MPTRNRPTRTAPAACPWGEAAALAVALSLDSLTVGIGAGLGQTPVGEAVLLSFLMGVGAILLGRWLGTG